MTIQVVMNWTNSDVDLGSGKQLDVRYRVYKEGDRVFQEICEVDGTPIHILELPDALALERSSFEVMLRYAMAEAGRSTVNTAVNY